jgi:hypothetical protein
MKILFGSGIGYIEIEGNSSVSLSVKKDYGEVFLEKEADKILGSVTEDNAVYLITLRGQALLARGNLIEKYNIKTLNVFEEEDDDE